MSWIIITISAYFLGALTIVLDKFILSGKKVTSPPVYSFYISLLGLGVAFIAPFSFYVPSGIQIVVSLFSGTLFTFGILALYYAINKSEASRVAPVVGASIPVIAYLFSIFLFGEVLGRNQLLGLIFLIFGGLLISFDLPLKIQPQNYRTLKKIPILRLAAPLFFTESAGTCRRKFFIGFEQSLLAGILMSGAYVFFKFVYEEQSFINGFMWTRFGSALAIACFFLVPAWRHDIIESLRGFRRPKSGNIRIGAIVILNKIVGGTSSILLNYAFKLGSVTLVNALVSSQYVFILVLAYGASLWHPKVFEEKLYFWDWAQKVAAIIIIAFGVWLVSLERAMPAGLTF